MMLNPPRMVMIQIHTIIKNSTFLLKMVEKNIIYKTKKAILFKTCNLSIIYLHHILLNY
jgi:hypothetical protein